MTSVLLRRLFLSTGLLTLIACGEVTEQANVKFGDQHFKTAIALIELHKVRFGTYPQSLTDLRYTGEWDQMALSAVDYHLLNDGYQLDVTRGWVGQPTTLTYPDGFWKGLGLRKTNMRHYSGT